jgi:stage II sporulation protein AA (anti-sigma F factor antagonist)
MHLTSFLVDGKLTIALTGEIDHHCAKEYIELIASKIEAYSPSSCTLDFRDVTFMDSSGIAVVINTIRQMKRIEGTVSLSGLGTQPMKVFKTSGIDKLINIEE